MRGLSRRHGLRPGLRRDLQDRMAGIFIVSVTREGRRDCVLGADRGCRHAGAAEAVCGESEIVLEVFEDD